MRADKLSPLYSRLSLVERRRRITRQQMRASRLEHHRESLFNKGHRFFTVFPPLHIRRTNQEQATPEEQKQEKRGVFRREIDAMKRRASSWKARDR